MKVILMSAALALVLSTQAQAEEIIHSVEIEKIDQVEFQAYSPMGWESDCTNLDNNLRPSSDPIDLTDILNLGEKVWEMIKENEPVLEAKGNRANALPRGLKCWDDLTNWSPTRAETYRVYYKNGFGMTVVNLEYRVVYTYGGKLDGKGNYLANASIQYKNVDVLWGYIFNADVEIPQVINMGSDENPLAGMEMTINWSVKTRPISLKKSINSTSFFVSGDGRPTRILN